MGQAPRGLRESGLGPEGYLRSTRGPPRPPPPQPTYGCHAGPGDSGRARIGDGIPGARGARGVGPGAAEAGGEGAPKRGLDGGRANGRESVLET